MNRLAKFVMAQTGASMSTSNLIYIMLLIASILMIVSMCVPYYTDSTGLASGVYSTGKDCLGFMGQDCMTIHTFPVLTVIFGLTVFIIMSAHRGMNRFPKIKTKILSFEKGLEGMRISVTVLLFLTLVFSIVTLGTQLGMPLSGSDLADQAKNSTTPTTFKDGMALSATATALFIFVFLMKIEVLTTLVEWLEEVKFLK